MVFNSLIASSTGSAGLDFLKLPLEVMIGLTRSESERACPRPGSGLRVRDEFREVCGNGVLLAVCIGDETG